MPEGEEESLESLKEAREKASTATGVALVLFAALIASLLGLWSQVGPFRKALAERIRYEARKAESDKRFDDLVGTEVRDTLQIEAFHQNDIARQRKETGNAALPAAVMPDEPVPPSPHPAQAGQECSFPVPRKHETELDPNDPRDLLRCLVKSKLSPDDLHKNLKKEQPKISLVLLENTIRDAEQSVARINGRVLQRFHLQRAIAQKAQFKLFDIEFSVDGFWAWDVWVALCASGVLYLWLVRRGTFMRARRISVMEGFSSFSAEVRPIGPWPLWLRPLPRRSRWAGKANSKRVDVVLDPLGVVCLLLMWVAIILAVAIAIRVAVIASFLISKADGLDWRFGLHAGVCCLAAGIIVGTLLDWYLPRGKRRISSSQSQPTGGPPLSRRAWLLGAAGALATGSFYFPQWRGIVFDSILHDHPRDPMLPRGPRKRRRRLENSLLTEGFYLGRPGRIYYLPPPPCKRSRAMDGLNQSELTPYDGPFDIEALHAVHRSALVPFVRHAVSGLIPHPYQLWDRKLHKQVLAQKSVQENYQKAFDLTLAAIHLDDRRRGRAGKLPNLQLYDLLGALAQSSGSSILLARVRDDLAKAAIRPLPEHKPAASNRTEGHESKSILKSGSAKAGSEKQGETKTLHSGHRHRKDPGAFLCRRQARLDGFRLQRLGSETPSTPNPDKSIVAPTPQEPTARLRPGTWNVKSVSDPSLQCSVHVVRQRKHARKGRQRKRKALDSC